MNKLLYLLGGCLIGLITSTVIDEMSDQKSRPSLPADVLSGDDEEIETTETKTEKKTNT